MAYKNQERSGDAYINDVYRRGTDGITLSEFHKIMAELLTEWKDAKADISGES